MNTPVKQQKSYIDIMEEHLTLEERIAKNKRIFEERVRQQKIEEYKAIYGEEAAKAAEYNAIIAKHVAKIAAERAEKVANQKKRQAANQAAHAAESQRIRNLRNKGGK